MLDADSPVPTSAFDRREWLVGAAAFAALFRGALAAPRAGAPRAFAFEPIAAGTDDVVRVPKGYTARVFAPWGTPLAPGAAAWSITDGAAQQAAQLGTHHDGIAFFPIDMQWDAAKQRLVGSSTRGQLVLNHEYTDEGLLHVDGVANWSAAKVLKSKAALGVSVLEVERVDGTWRVLGGQRVSGLDAIEMRGPARGHALLRTAGDVDRRWEHDGTAAEGTFANCANGVTPWGTYLTCEENFQDYFAYTPPSREQEQAMDDAGTRSELRMRLYGIGAPFRPNKAWRSANGWDQFDPRFDVDRFAYRNSCHRYGWVVEIDPRDPNRRAKRTALGRCRHENAAVVVAPDGRVVVYTGDDERFQCIYKFVSKDAFQPELASDDDAQRQAKRDHNWRLLDEGTLYAARFDAVPGAAGDPRRAGTWVELSLANEAIAASKQFADLAEIVVFARHAAKIAGASPMDRPEWIAVDQDPATRRLRNVYTSLSNNTQRGVPGKGEPDAANPRADNLYGHIVRWCETGGDPTATTFDWDVFVLCGNRHHGSKEQRGTIRDAAGSKEQDFGSPDGLAMDPRGGVLWVQTDVSTTLQGQDPYRAFGNNQMLAIDVATGEVRRFLVGPRGAEITGIAFTPDCRTLFVNVQHPGEAGDVFGDPDDALAVSSWPAGRVDGRPRSATLVITRDDGGEIGS